MLQDQIHLGMQCCNVIGHIVHLELVGRVHEVFDDRQQRHYWINHLIARKEGIVDFPQHENTQLFHHHFHKMVPAKFIAE